MSPTAQSDGHDGPGLLEELVPGIAAVIDEVILAGKYPVGEPVVAHELPNVFLRAELGTFGRQGDDADVGWHDELDIYQQRQLHDPDHRRYVIRQWWLLPCQVPAQGQARHTNPALTATPAAAPRIE